MHVKAGAAAGDEIKHARRRNRAYDLRDDLIRQFGSREALADHEADADRGV